MKIKEQLAKIDFSHVMCLFLGALIPIFADTLFLHEFNSSTVSAIMDTIMAIVAIYAAFGVRHWIKDRVKNKGFEHAQSILTDLYTVNKMFFDLHSNFEYFALQYMDGSELTKEEKNSLKLEYDALRVQGSKIREKVIETLVNILELSSWDMKCNFEKEYINYLKIIEDARIEIEGKLIHLDFTNHIVRLKQSNDYKKEFSETVLNCSIVYGELNKRFVSAFSYQPPVE
ncbi:hypothetical protein ACVNT8_004419 [Enterobacter cloacae]